MKHRTEAVVTADGSHTLFLPSLNETYHSIHGAVQESQTVFIEAGLAAVSQQQLHVFEMGFGTGLNALLTYKYASENGLSIQYTTVEAFPLAPETIKVLNYSQLPVFSGLTDVFHLFHSHTSENMQQISDFFHLEKVIADVLTLKWDENRFDIVYWDAFSPSIQPELWSKELFENVYSACRDGGILVTYSAAGMVKRNLKAAGFEIERLPGPPGKREIIRARKK